MVLVVLAVLAGLVVVWVGFCGGNLFGGGLFRWKLVQFLSLFPASSGFYFFR